MREWTHTDTNPAGMNPPMKITKSERSRGTHAHSPLTISRRNRIISIPEKIFVKGDPYVPGDLFHGIRLSLFSGREE